VPKLLLADDSPTTQKVVQLTFADEGIEVVVADDGDTAMELFNHHKPDVVLADINIPGLNGYEVCEAIRKQDGNVQTPVILLAGSFEPFNVEEARRVGASDYLTKPFPSIRRLVATVTALLDSVAKEDASVDETVQPNNTPPTIPTEPDVFSTNDIERLYSQSFAETVEMPHTVAERAVAVGAEGSETAAITDESAYDDELIETTAFSAPVEQETSEQPTVEPAPAESAPAEPSSEESAAAEYAEAGQGFPNESQDENRGFELISDHQNGSMQSEAPVAGHEQSFAPPSNVVQFSDLVQRDAPTEEFAIDQSGDETYFEPAAESVEQPAMTAEIPEPPSPEFLSSSYSPDTDRPLAELTPSEPPIFESPVESVSETPIEAPAPLSYDRPMTEPETTAQQEQPSTPTPWDSVADPKTGTYSFDDLNLLEIPVPGGQYRSMEEVRDASARTNEISSEVVEQIVKATATQISEELVREIAARIVPRVIEEVMARKDSEDIER